MKRLGDENFTQETRNGTTFSVVLWTVLTHPACIAAYDLLAALEKKSNPQVVQFCYVNIDAAPNLAMSMSIREVPYVTVHDKNGMVFRAGWLSTQTPTEFQSVIGDATYESIIQRLP